MFASDTAGPIAGPTLLDRLRREAEEMFDNIEDVEPSVGDSFFVHYDRKWANKHSVGQFGRMTLENGKPLFHAAPQVIEREKRYDMPEHDFIEFEKAWVKGAQAQFPMDRAISGPSPPVLVKTPNVPFLVQDYEKRLFEQILAMTNLVLINPSFKSMSNAISVCKRLGRSCLDVAITATFEYDWAVDVRNFVQNSQGFLRLVPCGGVSGIAYLGTNTPLWFPPTPWVRLIHSPFIDPTGIFEQYSVQFREDSFISRYQKKSNYEVTSVLSRDTGNFVYNPESLDEQLNIKGNPMLFFLESTLPLGFKAKDRRVVWHAPWFLTIPEKAHWSFEGGLELRLLGKEVYDVQGEGTYLSRRMRIDLPFPFKWAPLQKMGTHWITYSSLKPRRDYNVSSEVHDGKRFLNFGHSVLISGLRRVRAPYDVIFASKSRPPSGTVWDLESQEYVLASRPLPKDYKESVQEAFMDNQGRVFAIQRMANDALIFTPKQNGKQVLPFLPFGEVRYVPRFKYKDQDFICIDNTEEQVNFVFSSIAGLQSMIPTVSTYTSKFFSMRAIIEDTPDPDFGGSIVSAPVPVKIKKFMNRELVYSFSVGTTASQISRDVGISEQLAFHHLSKSPDYLLWKPGSVVMAEFVFLDQLDEYFVGDRIDSDAYIVDGRSWKDVYRDLSDSVLRVNSFLPFPRLFLSLLRNNGFFVKEESRLPLFHIRVKRPKKV